MSIVISKGPSGESFFVFCATTGELKKQVKQLNSEIKTAISVAVTMSRNDLVSLLNE